MNSWGYWCLSLLHLQKESYLRSFGFPHIINSMISRIWNVKNDHNLKISISDLAPNFQLIGINDPSIVENEPNFVDYDQYTTVNYYFKL